MKTYPTFSEETLLWSRGYTCISGLDEVGRGAFAGPLVTAAVVFPPYTAFTDPDLLLINDSKLVLPHRREKIADKIKTAALSWSIAEVSVEFINLHGIGKAAQKGFYDAYSSLSTPSDFCLIDAFWIKKIQTDKQKPIIRGDTLSISIAAASIIAKVHRDQMMTELHKQFPQYHFDQNKGYGTKEHQNSIRKFGLSSQHRTSFNLSSYTPYPSST